MPEAAATDSGTVQAPRSAGEMFWVFTRLALQGFGGVLPVAQRALVERHRWVSREDFLELMSVAQVLPGPNVVNLALMLGDRWFGGRGAAAAMAGILLAPLVCVLVLTVLAAQLQGVPAVAGALRGMGVVAAGLVLATALKLMGGLRRHPLGRAGCACFVALIFVAVGVLHWPLVWCVLGLGSVAVGLTWWRLGRTR
ncbi:MAG: chromate transporter [Burkholderiales bacterium]|nr:chromate transporter [Burkholderiales bacterium]MDE2274788.1 chromate transporter [Burkholderiales bacterium]